MPRASGRPADFCVDFPTGPVDADAPIGVAEVAHVARELQAALTEAGMPVVSFALQAGIDRTTVHDLLSGRAFIDVVTLARLEHATGRRLWPRTLP